ncbi:MAG: glutamate--cysteine ligase [Halioglobus sp.]|nr:glutamate--cysteine ligase [Halioglobus sp.]
MHKQLQALAAPDLLPLLGAIRRGIEKESLRISPDGKLAQTPHPTGLGSALTHAFITTDYSEALLEFITPVSTSIRHSLSMLEDIHSYVYRQLGDEILWCASMPCVVPGDAGIPVAQYGSSNVARMKTVYRYGLGHRYGRLMQTIAGIHYNFSMPQVYWDHCWRAAGSPGTLRDYISERYLGLIRNFRRHSWLLIYLYGASPAVCASFLQGRDDHGLQAFDAHGRSLYLPYGTSLRMGDLGYNSSAQKRLNICYNSLASYVDTLRAAILQPLPDYRAIPHGQGGDYQQLNDSLLQIENEFYSPIRPKRVARSGETPLNALVRAGIEYIEVRCVDVSPFTPVGMDAAQARFLDTFLLHCLLQDSPPCDDDERDRQAANLEAVVNRGRQPGLQLDTGAGHRPLKEWAEELLDAMRPVARLLDAAAGVPAAGVPAAGDPAAGVPAADTAAHTQSLAQQVAKVADSELTPSARVLREMREQDLPFFRLAMAYSTGWADHFRRRPLTPAVQAQFDAECRRSLAAQSDIEASDTLSFEQYLDSFFSQYQAL